MKCHLAFATLGLLASLFTGCSRQSPDATPAASAPSPPQPTPQQTQHMQQMLEAMAQVETRPVSQGQFAQAIQGRAGTNVDNLAESEREKLFACLSRFFACYSTGDYAAYTEFRLHAPFTISQRVVEVVNQAALDKAVELKSDEDILRFGWAQWNGTNRIGQISTEHILLSVVERQDLGQGLREPSVGQLEHGGVSSWSGAVVYQPTPSELLKKNGRLRFFRLELLVRCNTLSNGPAAPLVLIGY
jgi:hypothetical protein